MTSAVSDDGHGYADAAPQLLDSLFYAVSHDLRSPLLTVSLSAQLLEQTLGESEAEGTQEVLGGLRAACTDLERMLASLNALSRASRRASEPIELALDAISDGAPDALVTLDATTAADLRAAMADGATAAVEADMAIIRWPVEDLDGSPLQALAGSLTTHAGGAAETLACLEIALGRHQARLSVADNVVTVELPVTGVVPS